MEIDDGIRGLFMSGVRPDDARLVIFLQVMLRFQVGDESVEGGRIGGYCRHAGRINRPGRPRTKEIDEDEQEWDDKQPSPSASFTHGLNIWPEFRAFRMVFVLFLKHMNRQDWEIRVFFRNFARRKGRRRTYEYQKHSDHRPR